MAEALEGHRPSSSAHVRCAPGEVSLVLQGSLRSKLAAANRLLLDMTWQRGVKTSFTRILLVDDEGNLRMIITGMLEQSDGSSGW